MTIKKQFCLVTTAIFLFSPELFAQSKSDKAGAAAIEKQIGEEYQQGRTGYTTDPAMAKQQVIDDQVAQEYLDGRTGYYVDSNVRVNGIEFQKSRTPQLSESATIWKKFCVGQSKVSEKECMADKNLYDNEHDLSKPTRNQNTAW